MTLCHRLVIRLFIYSVWKVYGGCKLILKLFCFPKKYAIPWSNFKNKKNKKTPQIPVGEHSAAQS